MANWYGATRTNYFRVKDEERYQQIFSRLTGSEPIEDFTNENNGKIWHGFGAYCDIYYLKENTTDDIEDISVLLKDISSILTDDSVFVITCVGNEKLRYLTGICNMVFPNGKILRCDLADFAHKSAQEFFGKMYYLFLEN